MEKESKNKERRANVDPGCLSSLASEAFACISQGQRLEEENENSAALQKYLNGQEKLLEALNIRVPQGPPYESDRIMQAKMRKHLEELRGRISVLQREGPRNEAPPPYQETNANAGMDAAPSYTTSNEHLRPSSLMSEEIFCIPEGVCLFQVLPDGTVSSSQPSGSLQIMAFVTSDSMDSEANRNSTNVNLNTPPAFLQVGSWYCPLVPGQTVVLKTAYGAYMFPDVSSESQRGDCVGLILPAELSEDDRNRFERALGDLTTYREEPSEEPSEQPARVMRSAPMTESRTSQRISEAMVHGAGYLGTALSKGTEWTGYWVQRGAHKLREHMNPEDRPLKVDPRLQSSLEAVRGVTGVARKCSGFLVSKLSDMTCALARHAAPHVRHHGNKLLASSGFVGVDALDAANNNSTVIDDICVVAAGGVKGFSVLYMSLETAARQLASCLASETVQVVHHKYGSEASQVVDNAVSSLGNLALATNNVRSFGIKAIAKRTAKETGKAVLNEYVDKHKEPEQLK